MELHLISHTLGYGVGVVLSVLLLGLLHRASLKFRHTSTRNQPDARAKYYQAATALMWYLGGLLDTLPIVYGGSHNSRLGFAASILHFSGAAFFPAGFLALWRRPSDENSPRAKACSYLCTLAKVLGTILTICFIVIINLKPAHHPDDPLLQLMGNLLALHVAVFMGLGALLLLRGRLNDFAAKFYVATTLIGAMAPALMMIPLRLMQDSPVWAFVGCFIKFQTPLLVLLGAIVFFTDFRFSNVYAKSSLRFLVAILMALGFILLMIGPLPRIVASFGGYPTAGLVITATALLTLFLCTFEWLNPKLDRIVDCWLFREPDYETAARQIWDEISHRNDADSDAADEADHIFGIVARFVRETLDLEDARVIPVSALKTEHLEARLTGGEVCELAFDDPVKWQLGPSVEFLAPVRVKGKPMHVLAISPGTRRRDMLDSEIGFVRAVTGQVSSRLEALRFEKEKADRRNKEERLRRQVTEAELRALRAQINPHFLFNSLNTIADLIVSDPVKAERMTVQLARVFRHVLSHSDRQMITVGEEIEFLRTYLDIEAVRFGERLRIQFDVEAAVIDESVPSLILQPIVENALKHGLAHKIGSATLQINVRREDDFLRLMVEDDGPGFPPLSAIAPAAIETNGGLTAQHQVQRQNGNGVGLRNVTERLTTLYSGRGKILFERIPHGGSRVTLLLPCLAHNGLW